MYQASIDIRENVKGNTPLLLAAGSGVTNTCVALIQSGCDKNAVNLMGKGALQKAIECSTTCANKLRDFKVRMAWVDSGRTRAHGSIGISRLHRRTQGDADPDTRRQLEEQRLRARWRFQRGKGGNGKGNKGKGNEGKGDKGKDKRAHSSA